MTTPIKVGIWSDVQCPWCFIGKRKFEAGVAEFGRPVEIEYHSFELAPDTPVDFEGSTKEYIVERKGLSEAQVDEMLARVTGIAANVGLKYDFDQVKQTNTTKAHELLHFAKAHGKQPELKERLLSAHFEEGKHVGKLDQLADLAAEVGLDRASALAQAYGISGVPFYVINGEYGISGAQDSSTFAAVLAKATEG